MRTFTLVFLCCAMWGNAKSQHYTQPFFPNMEFRNELDTISHKGFSEILFNNKMAFSQPLFTYGSEDSLDWELISKAYIEYPEIVLPRINTIDLNKDGHKDLVLSFLGGNEYSFVGFYVSKDEGYDDVFYKVGELFGVYQNGDVSVRVPACCDDPTNEFYRYSISELSEVNCVDSFSISTWRVKDHFTTKELFDSEDWKLSPDTLFTYQNLGEKESFGYYLPDAKYRVIREKEVDGGSIRFCEIIGRAESALGSLSILPHAFVWLTTEDYD